ncbi:TPA: YdgA family protein [Escherichia coli]|nr:YdgA family protein [Escherichia coli]
MNKSLVAVGVIVALGVVWTGGAWYTGKKIETHLEDMVAQANAQLKLTAPESNLEVSYQNYHRGVFSSQLQLLVKPIAGKENPWIKSGQSVIFNESVDHGPFPLAQLKKLNLIPSMASIQTTLVNNEVSKPLFDMAKGETPFEINSRIGYSGDSSSDISLKPLNYEQKDEKVAFSGGEFQLNADRDGKAISLSGEAQSGRIDAVNEYNQKVQLTFNNLKTDGSSTLASFGERVGNQKLSLEKMTIPVDMATEFMTQVAKLEGYQEDQAKKLAKQQVEGASAMGQMFRLTTLQDNTITTSLQYANGQITLNGQKMSLEDFVGMFAMPALNVPAVPAIPQQ